MKQQLQDIDLPNSIFRFSYTNPLRLPSPTRMHHIVSPSSGIAATPSKSYRVIAPSSGSSATPSPTKAFRVTAPPSAGISKPTLKVNQPSSSSGSSSGSKPKKEAVLVLQQMTQRSANHRPAVKNKKISADDRNAAG